MLSLLRNTALLLLLLLGSPTLSARRVKVQHRASAGDTLRLDPKLKEVTVGLDSAVRIAGYDKNRESTRESLFLSNTGTTAIRSITFVINYLDMEGRQLHKRRVTVPCLVPSGETRRLEFKSWDTQNSFYYHRSRVPKRTQATPYDVTIQPVLCITE